MKTATKRAIRLTADQISYLEDLLTEAENRAQLELPDQSDEAEEALAMIQSLFEALSVTA